MGIDDVSYNESVVFYEIFYVVALVVGQGSTIDDSSFECRFVPNDVCIFLEGVIEELFYWHIVRILEAYR